MDGRVDLEMIKKKNDWPIWPMLPMKRSWDQKPSEGIIYNITDFKERDELWWYPGQNRFTFDGTAEHTVLDDKGIEKLIDEGWKVD